MPIERYCYRPHNPANYTPENFMQSPTSPVWPELKYISRELRKNLEGINFSDKDTLQIGTEFEVFFFNNEVDPYKTFQKWPSKNSRKNPNHFESHHQKVRDIEKEAGLLQAEYPEQFGKCNRESRLFLEFRTVPQTLEKHLDTVFWLRDWIGKQAKIKDVMPIIHSQHIHISVNRKIRRTGLIPSYKTSANYNEDVASGSFTRVLPLVLLPEEYDRGGYIIACAAETKGRWQGVEHPEFRLLSSEFACDPVLNLTLSLRALYASLIDSKYVSIKNGKGSNYTLEVAAMAKDPELIKFFGGATLSTLTKIISQYPDISRRKITIDQIKYNSNE